MHAILLLVRNVCDVTRTIPRQVLTKRRRYFGCIRPLVQQYFRDEHGTTCMGCGTEEWTEIHHVVPLAAGGTNDHENLVALCHECHMAAHRAWDPSDDGE